MIFFIFDFGFDCLTREWGGYRLIKKRRKNCGSYSMIFFIFAFGFDCLTRGWGGYVKVPGIVELDLIVCRDMFVANCIFCS